MVTSPEIKNQCNSHQREATVGDLKTTVKRYPENSFPALIEEARLTKNHILLEQTLKAYQRVIEEGMLSYH